ncbi:MAG: DNA-3-methyladenine glycosylase 2 family protein [Bacteroidia bacterium]|nr:DNA-3-methyladenine glycosylase 2 family protein [Bacteroidia bacterium]MCZ2277406.1 DNA-3-methyladenine glycosylase 2 family protein [Bacteroidia bacterium]
MKYLNRLKKDKKLTEIINQHGQIRLMKNENIFWYLCSSIISQQLSVKAAYTIKNRFLYLFDGKIPTDHQILSLKTEKMRKVGLSNSKCHYIKNVAAFSVSKGMSYKKLSVMADEEIISYLTEIKGVGRWTVEMVLIFALQREDVFPVDDGGIVAAMKKLYQINTENKSELKSNLSQIAELWSPFRSYACLYLWKYKDAEKP